MWRDYDGSHMRSQQVIATAVILVVFVGFVLWNPKVSRDGRFMRVCEWVSRRYNAIQTVLVLCMVQAMIFMVWQFHKEVEKRDQQIEQLKKKCP